MPFSPERDAAVKEGGLRTKANALAIFRSKNNLPNHRADQLYDFINELLRTQINIFCDFAKYLAHSVTLHEIRRLWKKGLIRCFLWVLSELGGWERSAHSERSNRIFLYYF